jgi:hypothetical protein
MLKRPIVALNGERDTPGYIRSMPAPQNALQHANSCRRDQSSGGRFGLSSNEGAVPITLARHTYSPTVAFPIPSDCTVKRSLILSVPQSKHLANPPHRQSFRWHPAFVAEARSRDSIADRQPALHHLSGGRHSIGILPAFLWNQGPLCVGMRSVEG